MDQRIRDFELLWNALFHRALVPPPSPLVRSTCEHWTLPDAERERWFAAPTVAEREAILAANRTERRYSWNEPVEIDPEEARLNKELHFGYETYGPLPYYDPAAPDQEFEPPQAEWLQRTTAHDFDLDQEIAPPRADWFQRVVGQDLTEQPRAHLLQRTTGQRVALPAEAFERWGLANAEEKQAIVAEHLPTCVFEHLEDQDTLQAAAQDPVQAQDPAPAQDGFPAPLIAPLLLDQDDITEYFKPWKWTD